MPADSSIVTAADAVGRRRDAFARDVGRPVLLCAGSAPPRNYPANRHPFRASSHFLHFVGAAIEGAAILITSDGSTLFVPEADADDALWHGPSKTRDDLALELGMAVRPIADLERAVTIRRPIALASHDPSIREQLARLDVAAATGDEHDALVDAIIGSRLVNDAYAVAELRRAAGITTRAHLAGMAETRPGISASRTRAIMEAVITSEFATTAYPSIVTPRGEVLHAGPNDVRLAHGDYLLCDVGAEVPSGYASDVTRTFPVNGRFEDAARDLYRVVLDAQLASIAAVRVGVRYRDVHLVAMRTIARGLSDLGILLGDPVERTVDGSVARFFPHGVGHLLGLDVHDMEDLGDRAGYAPGRERSTDPGVRYLRLDRDLGAGVAFTIEPGVYFIPQLLDPDDTRREFAGRIDFDAVERHRSVRGVRIEDDVLLQADGPEVLTALIPKEPIDLESIVGIGAPWASDIDIERGPALGSEPDQGR